MNHATNVHDQSHRAADDRARRYILVSDDSMWRADVAKRLQGSSEPMVCWRHTAGLIQITEPDGLAQLLEAHMAVPGRRVLVLAGPKDVRVQDLVFDSGTEATFAEQVHFREDCRVADVDAALQVAEGDVVMAWLEASGLQAPQPVGPPAFADLELRAHEAWIDRFVKLYGANPFEIMYEEELASAGAPDPATSPNATASLERHRYAHQFGVRARAEASANDQAYLSRAMAASASNHAPLPAALSGEFILPTDPGEAPCIAIWALTSRREDVDGSLEVQAKLTLPRAPALTGCTDFQIEFLRTNDLPWIVDLAAPSETVDHPQGEVWWSVFNISRDEYASLETMHAQPRWRDPREG